MAHPELHGIRAVYMDLDDTLCAYWDASKLGLRQAFDSHPVAGKTTDDMVRHWAAAFQKYCPTVKHNADLYKSYLQSGEVTRTEQMRRTLAEAGVEDEAHAQRLSQAYMEFRDGNLALFPEATRFLETLRSHYPLGLITNGPADIQRQEVNTLGIEHYFDHVFIEGEMGEGKPLQSVFRRAEAAVGFPSGAILFVGNSYEHDIAPAVDAGWKSAWIRRPSDVPPSATPGRGEPEAKPEDGRTPTMIVESLDEILVGLGLSA